MLKFAANISMLFTDVPFLDRFRAAKDAGFKYIEFLLPYEYKAEDLVTLLSSNGLTQCLFNLPSGDWAGGERGIAALPDRVNEFREGIPKAIEYAKTMQVPALNCLSGKATGSFSFDEHWKTLIGNIQFAADALALHGLTLMVENVNNKDVGGFYLYSSELALKAIAEANRPNVRFQYDIYHAQRIEGELVNILRNNFAFIGHIQIADNPKRNQPGTGEINYPFIFKELVNLGYTGYIGLEYVPAPDTLGSLHWIKEYGYTL